MNSKPAKKVATVQDVELVPDAWPRFERMVKVIAKAGPQHREAAPKPPRKKAATKKTKPA